LPASQNAVFTTDREKVYAILTNLVKNAIKYTEKGNVELGCVSKGTLIEFYVSDTGIGVPLHRQKAIFERFIQADIEDTMAYQGAGLGLSISKAYVEMLGGKIWLESEDGKGSTFCFTLPYKS
jgi:signal transduction histidine kinase